MMLAEAQDDVVDNLVQMNQLVALNKCLIIEAVNEAVKRFIQNQILCNRSNFDCLKK